MIQLFKRREQEVVVKCPSCGSEMTKQFLGGQVFNWACRNCGHVM